MQKLFFLSFVFLLSCSVGKSPNKFSDAGIVKIYDLKDRRATDSLLIFLRSENVSYRREAALAFASVQDSLASLSLGTALLEDPDNEVKRNAAFSLGQTGGTQAVNALIPAIEISDRNVLSEVLEALGKTIQKEDIKILTDFNSKDTLIEEGQARGFYQLSLRRKADSTVTIKASEYLDSKKSFQTRLAAANYFARSQKLEGENFNERLINAAQMDVHPEVRMASISGFRHIEVTKALPVINKISISDKDFRVRISAIRACQNFPLMETQDIVFKGLEDPDEMVRVAASEVIRSKIEKPLNRLSPSISSANNTRVKANLYAALLKSESPEGFVQEIIDNYQTASPYYKANLLSALGEAQGANQAKAFEFLSQELLNDKNEKVITTSAADAIVSINRNFMKQASAQGGWTVYPPLSASPTTMDPTLFIGVYKKAIAKGDEAVSGIIAGALMNKDLHYKEQLTDITFLKEAKAKLSLPKDLESLQPLENAIAYLEGREKPAPLKNKFNHPIDWETVKTINSDQKIEIKTSKGTIVLKLLIEDSPGSAINFVELVKRNYYDGKFFHRVVPNFVIQTGCNRGDGYGGEDYSIRSEFSLRKYNTGSVGMASAGKDTEGTQWFITHSPTPHLDGRYTIFAETISGMEIVHKIEVGDKIIEARLKD
ncbi:MAG: hypothetical protein HOP08_09235 [Cyclobacteriaceae bacterium]|nr:hypothetical protein [Cyclobacteriaceae bacterium]